MGNKNWSVVLWGKDKHVVPNNDLCMHRIEEDCVCGPTAEARFVEDGSNFWIYIHWALDGRP